MITIPNHYDKLIAFLPSFENRHFLDTCHNFGYLFGQSIARSPSPRLHNFWFQENHLGFHYTLREIENEELFLETVENLTLEHKQQNDLFFGGNITMPFKNAITHLQNILLSSNVKEICAANTLFKNNEGVWCAENTDVLGIEKTFDHFQLTSDSHCLILGGGGAAAAALWVAKKKFSSDKIFVLTRSVNKLVEQYPHLVKDVHVSFLENQSLKKWCEKFEKQNVIINCLPVLGGINRNSEGILIDENPYVETAANALSHKNSYYFDMKYENTTSLLLANQLGLRCFHGMEMFLTQAQESFFLWTGIRPQMLPKYLYEIE